MPDDAHGWRPIETAPCDDRLALVNWQAGAISIEDLDHDSTPEWWAKQGATHWHPLPDPPVMPDAG